ncbi:hypothetical protein Poli38472_006557 [Pythium oligandrum]|uniref:Phospholipid-transporting ATPase n=1 Tax=Pythium oligandrum TaxID=41045 RepID=A0A8K1C5Q3_PYTOL|nr:hypothetical protein Poli38472_006557 [Pythium oligandrum]|eukprot:TMW56547.1 hypothetical protein Poli38472_006557 [Pythium oligandrum]
MPSSAHDGALNAASGGRSDAGGVPQDDTLRIIRVDRPAIRLQAEAAALERGHDRARWFAETREANLRRFGRRRVTKTIRRDDGEEETLFAHNEVVSAKYSLLNFAPRVLLAQLKRPSNVYFLFIAVLQTIKEVSNTRGVPTILLPLAVVFVCSAFKEALEDRERHRADVITNSQTVLMLNASGVWEQTKWGDLQVGDIVRVREGETIPADLFLLSSEEQRDDDEVIDLLTESDAGPESDSGSVQAAVQRKSGSLAYIETKSLDGETNLKIRAAIGPVSVVSQSSEDLSRLRCVVECEQPNNRINSFEGNLNLTLEKHQALEVVGPTDELTDQVLRETRDSITIQYPITAKQMILRSCVLRNTRSITGMVVFTGHETKVFCSNTDPVVKSSSVEQRLNGLIIGVVLIQQLVCFLGALLGAYWIMNNGDDHWYLVSRVKTTKVWHKGSPIPLEELLKLHLRYFIIMQNFVPISLNVSLEFVKYWQAYFMEQDVEMYDEASDTPAMVRTSALNEDLGRVHHVFTDKTGTLTMNLMVFRCCMIDGKHYGGEIREDELEASTTDVKSDSSRYVAFDPTELFADLAAGGQRGTRIQFFLRHLALCHTLIPAKSFSEMCAAINPEYSASSPDEQALVSAAAYCNVRFVHRSPSSITLLEPGTSTPVVYKVLNVLEFDSDRKRMTIIVETPESDIVLLCKGADNVILERLEVTPTSQELIDDVYSQLSEYARTGMRTLCLASKHINRSDYEAWNERFQAAHSSMEELVKRRQGLANAIEPLMNEIEQGLVLLGVTAVQDKLQQGVPKTLSLLQETGIKVWTLTGDKMETAVNIGYACNLLSDGMEVKQLASEDYASTIKSLQKLLTSLERPSPSSSAALTSPRRSPGSSRKKRRQRQAKKRAASLSWFESFTQFFGGTANRTRGPSSRLRKPNHGSGTRSPSSQPRRYSPEISHDSDSFGEDIVDDETGSLLAASMDELRTPKNRSSPVALVIDGATLEHALRPRVRPLFYDVTKKCRSVICCRVSPKQKSDVVEFIRQLEPESITLSIGDGANDVGMIQAAHIGVGISGLEGTQAVNASDYAIAQFRFLQRLLFVHGRWAYRRVAKLMSYMLYKNVTYVLTTFWFGCYCGFSGQPLIIDIAAQSFNVLYTSLPLVLFAVFDQDVSSKSASKFPYLYSLGQKNVLLAKKVFWPWILSGIWHSVVIFFLSTWGFEGDLAIEGDPVAHPTVSSPSGQDDGLVTLGFVVFTNLVVVVNLKLCLETFMLTWYFLVTIAGSILLWFVVGNIISSPHSGIMQSVGEMPYIQRMPSFWFLCVLVITISLFRDSLWKVLRRIVFPSTYHILQEREMLQLPNSPQNLRRESLKGSWKDAQSIPVVGYTKILQQIPLRETEQDAFVRNSPLAERLMDSRAPQMEQGVRARGSFHAVSGGDGLREDDEIGELRPGLRRESSRNMYHGYAFSEDENVDSDVEAASSKLLRKSSSLSRSMSGLSSPGETKATTPSGRTLKKMLKSVRGTKNA